MNYELANAKRCFEESTRSNLCIKSKNINYDNYLTHNLLIHHL